MIEVRQMVKVCSDRSKTDGEGLAVIEVRQMVKVCGDRSKTDGEGRQ